MRALMSGLFGVAVLGITITFTVATNAATFEPITPFNIPNSTVSHDLTPAQVEKARQQFSVFATAAQKFGASQVEPPINSASRTVVTRFGDKVDTYALFQYMNIVERALNRHGKTLRDPNLSTVNIDDYPELRQVTPSYNPLPRPQARYGATPQPASPPTAAPSTLNPACSGLPTPQPGIDAAWRTIEKLSGTTTTTNKVALRCSLQFASTLTAAEQQAVGIPPVIALAPLAITQGDDRGLAQFSIRNAFQYNATQAELTFTSTLEGAFLGHTFTVATVDADVSAHTSGTSSAQISVTAGDAELYKASGSWKELNLSLIPSRSIDIFTPFIGTFPIGPMTASFEVDGKGLYGFNGTIQTNNIGVYMVAKPSFSANITGSLKANAIFISGELDGDLSLVTFQGEVGGLAAVFADSTYAGSAKSTPVVAVLSPTANYAVSALTGGLSARVQVALFGTVLSKKLQSWGPVYRQQQSIPTVWSAYHLADQTP